MIQLSHIHATRTRKRIQFPHPVTATSSANAEPAKLIAVATAGSFVLEDSLPETGHDTMIRYFVDAIRLRSLSAVSHRQWFLQTATC